jgi:hypothetical protein
MPVLPDVGSRPEAPAADRAFILALVFDMIK